MYRYFLHQLSDWPLAGACNDAPLGPDVAGDCLATLDASDPQCDLYKLEFAELSASEAQQWVVTLAAAAP